MKRVREREKKKKLHALFICYSTKWTQICEIEVGCSFHWMRRMWFSWWHYISLNQMRKKKQTHTRTHTDTHSRRRKKNEFHCHCRTLILSNEFTSEIRIVIWGWMVVAVFQNYNIEMKKCTESEFSSISSFDCSRGTTITPVYCTLDDSSTDFVLFFHWCDLWSNRECVSNSFDYLINLLFSLVLYAICVDFMCIAKWYCAPNGCAHQSKFLNNDLDNTHQRRKMYE